MTSTTLAPSAVETGAVARRGALLTFGAIAMATTFYLYPEQQGGTAGRVGDVGGLAFQAGLFGLLWTHWQTCATGTRRAGRALLVVELGMLVPATLWSACHLVLPAEHQDQLWLAVLDVFWPLSMLGMLVIGVVIAVSGRWRGPLRWWSLFAESWAPLSIAVVALLPEVLANALVPSLMVLGYGGLGVLLATRTHLALADH